MPGSDRVASGRRCSRRRYLALVGAASAAALPAGRAAGQATETTETDGPGNRITRRLVIPEIDRFRGEYGQDKFVHVIEPTGASLDWAEFGQCGFANWSPENTSAFRVSMVDSLRDYPRAEETGAFALVDGYEPLEPGSLYVVNDVVQCPGRYVGLEIEWLSGDVGPLPGEGQADGETGVFGPGFGAVGAVAGILGGAAAYLTRARRD